MAKARKVTVLQGVGAFVGPNHLAVTAKDGRKVIAFKSAIIAAGSQSARVAFADAKALGQLCIRHADLSACPPGLETEIMC